MTMIPKTILAAVAVTSTAATAGTLLYEPSFYFSERDSPFYGGIVDNTGDRIWLEDFEDQSLNTPFVEQEQNVPWVGSTLRAKIQNPGERSVWGVDGDDGVIDGQGFAGDVWISTALAGNGPHPFMSFVFTPDDEGRLPRYVGIVVTQVRNIDTDVGASWKDADGNSVEVDGGFAPQDWGVDPETGERFEGLFGGDSRLHRFIGLYHEDGISKLTLSNVQQADHLQYGFSIPEPSTHFLTALAFGLVLGRRRRS